MAYSDAMLLQRELEEWPPVRMTVAQYLGYGKKFVEKPIGTEDFIGLQMMTGNRGLSKMPVDFKESIRWAEEMKKKMSIH